LLLRLEILEAKVRLRALRRIDQSQVAGMGKRQVDLFSISLMFAAVLLWPDAALRSGMNSLAIAAPVIVGQPEAMSSV